MPRVLDNLTPGSTLLSALQQTLAASHRADFCVGYFNLRGWKHLDSHVERWPQGIGAARVLVGMQRRPHDELREALNPSTTPAIDAKRARSLKQELAQEFRDQLVIGIPNNSDESALRRLVGQLRTGKAKVKLHLRHPLHAKLYLCFRSDQQVPIVGYLGSSNLTFAGLGGQGELNVDIVDQDACQKLTDWFELRWNDQFSLDITAELIQIVEESWAREALIPPYLIYLKMAYHLSREARAGLAEFRIPTDFGNRMFDFQTAAVKIAAHHLNKRGGVLVGDVVGLGKTLMATALARIFEDDFGLETLIICPRNLVSMWEDYVHEYRLRAKVLSLSRVITELPNLRRYRLVLIDESHNLRNREGKRYRAIQEYIRANDSKCILLSATPYNKTYLDLASQLRLFVDEDQDLGIRPERLMKTLGEIEFSARHQANPRTMAAFELSEYADDWRELMRLYLVRRTRTFIQDNYADTDEATGRRYLTYEDGSRSFFPTRVPRTVRFLIDESDPRDRYAKLYSSEVVQVIGNLRLPRYGLGEYLADPVAVSRSDTEKRQVENLSRAGKRLIGFCRVNLFKRLESSGWVFLQSVERHILRNHVFLHAIRNELPLPIGPQDAEMLDSRFTDEDVAEVSDDQDSRVEDSALATLPMTEASLAEQAAAAYDVYRTRYKGRFRWLRPALFTEKLRKALDADAKALLRVLRAYGRWDPAGDAKLNSLHRLLTRDFPDRKILVFSQFADTVRYLEQHLRSRGVAAIAGVTGDSPDPTYAVRRFSPVSNRKTIEAETELRVVIATDLLSEGQNLQDCSIVVNYDLPWAIIRLIQRAGRVDRIGQTSAEILCYSFLPTDGVEKLIRLRGRVRERLHENAEVVGADEAFFEDEAAAESMVDLYHERAGILDGDADGEVDLASHAYQIWKNAVDRDPRVAKKVEELPDVVFATRAHQPTEAQPEGVLVFLRTAEDNDMLAYVDRSGQSITESQAEILALAACRPGAAPKARQEDHHRLVRNGVHHIATREQKIGGSLGRLSSARHRVYVRLKAYAQAISGTLLDHPELRSAISEIYHRPLRQSAVDTLNQKLRSGIANPQLADLVRGLRADDRLCLPDDEASKPREPRIICSLGLFADADTST